MYPMFCQVLSIKLAYRLFIYFSVHNAICYVYNIIEIVVYLETGRSGVYCSALATPEYQAIRLRDASGTSYKADWSNEI